MNFDDMMADLRKDYVAGMPQKLEEIKKLAANGDTSGLREIFHKLKGSGKTYGVPEVSDLFEVCEKLCLNKPQAAPQVAPIALQLLASIYDSRKSGGVFAVKDTAEFKTLLSL